MTDELTWREAEDAMERGELVRSGNVTYRLSADGRLEHRSDGKLVDWSECYSTHFVLRSLKWERVPKAPRVHELPERWRAGTFHGPRFAEELEAALREDELVSLKGVTEAEIRDAWNAHYGSEELAEFTLKYLRERSKR